MPKIELLIFINQVRDNKHQPPVAHTVDALINNAGIAAMNALLTTPLSSAQRVLGTNFLGSFLFLREFGEVMIRARSGQSFPVNVGFL